ncbi:MAG: TonB-dependent receptor [Burkholderiales bacterium]|nr:MAG: TonB-dependent receptor [Burkholderiales bacterium]
MYLHVPCPAATPVIAPSARRLLAPRRPGSGRDSGSDARMVRRTSIPLALALVVAWWGPWSAGPAFAQPEHDRALESVVVTATRSPAAALGVPASVTVVGEDELEARKPVRLGDALADVPGLYVRGAAMGAGFPGSGQAVLSLRGIPRTPRTLVMIDGQPVNNALSGGVNVVGIPFDNVERAEVVRGPYSALYGGNAMGGVINFITASPDDPLTALHAGAGNLRQRGATIIHRKRYDGGLGVSMSVGYRESAGDPDSDYVVKRPVTGTTGTPVTGALPTASADGTPGYWVGTKGARPWSQSNAQLSMHYSPSAATKLVAGLGWADYSVGYSRPNSFLLDAAGTPVYSGAVLFDDAGSTQRLSLAQTDWFTPTPSGERDRRVFVRAEHRLDGGSELRAQLGTLRHGFFFAQATPGQAGYDAGPGNLTDQPNRRIDADLSLRTPMAPTWAIVSGLSLNRSTMDRKTLALSDWRDTDTTGAVLNAGSGSSNNAALFFQSEHYFDNGLTGYVGGRYDRFETQGRVIQNTAPAFDQRYESRSFDQFSPKLALVWEAQRWLSLRVSYGEGFRPPALLDMYARTAVPTATAGVISVNEPSPDLGPERVRAFEVGADMAFAGGGRASLTLYRQRLEDLIYRRRLSPTLTQTENAGEADVDGMEASVRWPTQVRGLRAFGALTHHFRYEITSNDAVPASVGKKLTDVPRTIWSAGLEYERGPWSGLLAVRRVGHVFGSGDDLNANTVDGVFGSYDRHTVVAARVAWRIDRHWGASLTIDNLTDREYFVFNRQPGRTVYGELSYRF